MSAATETLIEQIRLTEETIALVESRGEDASLHKADLKHLQRKLQTCSEALTEGKRILKG